MPQIAHGLDAFLIFEDVLRLAAVHHVPIRRTHDGHGGDREVLVEDV